MISCDKAAIICNKAQYKEATEAEISQLKQHLSICEVCAAFTDKNTQLTTLCERANLYSLSEADKLKMKEQLKSGS